MLRARSTEDFSSNYLPLFLMKKGDEGACAPVKLLGLEYVSVYVHIFRKIEYAYDTFRTLNCSRIRVKARKGVAKW